ncbi:MAG: hypothetical protein JRH20_22375 [Deltaproteobacteria bacterium]|nr:hypothetical protein [Deltaproteobacteria bacterium]
MRGLLGGVSALLLVGCASNEYLCPKPIGKIIRDDCEVYRTRFDTLKAELSASLGPVSSSVKLGKESLRDPSQLMQILAHRTHALCRDFNACRVSPLQYRERRERTDHIFTAVGALSAQLKTDLPKEEKAKLVAKLLSLLTAPAPSTTGTRPPAQAQSVKRRSGSPYMSWLPWYGTKRLPPQPKARGKGPQVAHAKFSVRHVFRSGQGVVGYGVGVTFLVRGRLASDDQLTMDYGAKRVDCRLSRSSRGVNGLVSVRCKTPKKEALTTPTLRVTLLHATEDDDKAKPIGTRVFRALSRISNPRNGSRTFAEDHDPAAHQLRLRFRPLARLLPPDFERPSLLAVLKMRDYRRKSITARCWVDGKPATGAIATYGRHTGQVGQYQDKDRYRSMGPGRSVAVKHPFITWRRYDFPLPFYVRHQGEGSAPKGTKEWPKAGKWRCVVSIEGEPVREARFVVKANGLLKPHARQGRQPSADWWLETKVMRSKLEEPLR